MEQLVTVLTFFFLTWAYGFSLLQLTKATPEKHFAYQFLAELALGVAVFSFLGIVFELVHIPLHMSVYLILGALYPAYALVRSIIADKNAPKKQKKQPFDFNTFIKQREVICTAILLVLAGVFFAIYLHGAFAYPYLEDDDPWGHALGASYVSMVHTYNQHDYYHQYGYTFAAYLEPYPPTYDVMMGVLHQLAHSMYWTLKFFNVLLVTLTLVFAFLFAKEFFKDDYKALFATFVLATLPSFMGHFIWSQTLALLVFMIAGYAMLRAREEKSWVIPAGVAIASMLVTQPVVSFVFGITMLLVVALHALRDLLAKKLSSELKNLFWCGLLGVVLSMLFWGAQLAHFGLSGIRELKGGEVTGWGGEYALQKYALSEIVFTQDMPRIDQATGFGWMLSILLLVTLVIFLLNIKKIVDVRKDWRKLFLLIWFLLLFFVVISASIGIGIAGVARAWAYLAIPLALIATEGLSIILKSLPGTQVRVGVIVAVVLLIAFSGGVPKYKQQTSVWPPGVDWTSQQELTAYTNLRETEGPLKIFAACARPKRLLGLDQIDYGWIDEGYKMRDTLPNRTADEIVTFMEKYDYDYLTFDTTCVRLFGQNVTQDILTRISESGRFTGVKQEPGFVLVKRA